MIIMLVSHLASPPSPLSCVTYYVLPQREDHEGTISGMAARRIPAISGRLSHTRKSRAISPHYRCIFSCVEAFSSSI